MNLLSLKSSRSMRLLCLFGAILGATASFAGEGASKQQISIEPMSSRSLDIHSAWDYRQDGQAGLWLAYYDKARLLHLRSPSGDDRLLVPEGRAQAPSGLALSASEGGVHMLWRDKFPKKGLFLFDSTRPESAPVDVGGDSEPLARFRLASAGNGLTHMLWYGEKSGQPTGELHNLYYRNQDPKTGVLSPVAMLMSGIYPVMSADTAGNLMVYSWSQDQGMKRIVARFRDAGAQQDAADGGFGEAAKVADVPEMTPIFEAFRSGSRWFVMWLSQYGADKSGFLLEGAHSDDKGKTWTHFSFEDLRGYDIASLQTATDDAGHLLIGVTGRLRKGDAQPKQDVFLIRSDDGGDTWTKAVRLREPMPASAAPAQGSAGSLSAFHARNLSLAFGSQPGQVLAVWEDWRNIRSSLYASLSNDFGRTWDLTNVPLPVSAGKNLGLRFEPNAIYFSGGRYHVIAEQPTDDAMKAKDLVRLSFSVDDLKASAEAARSAPRKDPKEEEAVVRAREEGFWKSLMEGDYAKTFEFQDPFFRARTNLQVYLSTMGKIKYSSAHVDSVRIDGLRAEVTTTIRASVPAFKVPSTGETISQPERKAAVKSTWLWLDDQWVREFRVESRDIIFTQY